MMPRTDAILHRRNEKGLAPAVMTPVASSRPLRGPLRLRPRGSGTAPCRTRALRFLLLYVVVSLGLFGTPAGAAQEGDKTYQTQYVTITYADEKDLLTFTRNIGSGLSFLREGPEKNPLLAKRRVDKIVESVCSLLDMSPSNLHFSIILYKSQEEVSIAYHRAAGTANAYNVHGARAPAPIAFYAHGPRSIAVNIDNIAGNILAHEIAHAIISAYYNPPPPGRMQEILAQYMDKHFED